MSAHELAGKPAPRSLLENIPRLIAAYYTRQPDAADASQLVAFGTSGHRGSSLRNSFNEAHILAISQAICEYRQAQGTDGPLFLGMDTHALSEPAFASAIEVFAANNVELFIDACLGYTPTPVISHAILTYNRAWGQRGKRPTALLSPRPTTPPRTAATSTTRHTAVRPIRQPLRSSSRGPTN